MANGNDNQQAVIISDLILAAAEGAGEGLQKMEDANVPVELAEFEIEVVYSCTTTFEKETTGAAAGSASMKFLFIKAKAKGHYKSRTVRTQSINYGLKVRFLFVGKEAEEEGSAGSTGGSVTP